MKEIVIVLTCDMCKRAAQDNEGSVKTRRFDIDGKLYEMETCGKCNRQALPKLTLRQLSRKARKIDLDVPDGYEKLPKYHETMVGDRFLCPQEDCGHDAPTGGGLATHHKRVHGISLQDALALAALDPANS